MRPGVSWDALRVFMAVFRAGSFSAAAAELGSAQSSVSEQVARLEADLGHRLFDRSPSGVGATDRGRELAARIADAVDGLAAATDNHPGRDADPRAVFVGGPAEFLSEVVLPELPSRLDGTQVVARFGTADDLLDELADGTLDVLVSALPVRRGQLSAEPICDEEFALVGHPRWAEQAAADLEAIPVLAYGPELPIVRRYWRSVFGHRPTRPPVRIIAPDLRTLLRLAVEGVGMTVLPDYLLRAHLDSGVLVLLHEPEVPPLNTLYVATRAGRTGRDAAALRVRREIAAIARAAQG